MAMESKLFDLLLRLTLLKQRRDAAGTAARAPLRRLAGAQAAYLCWVAVPLALLAAALPVRMTPKRWRWT
ncbi:hypothetical protein LP419_12150 [Massilia sp. H-1]|nr:hypothetical protein LP419_12150 [Massilia sp. H-1]